MFFVLRRNRKKAAPTHDPFDGLYSPSDRHAMSSAAATSVTGGGGSSSNARPLVAPYRPVSKMGVEDTYQQSMSSTSQGYYEDTSPQHRFSAGTAGPIPGYTPGQQYYSSSGSEPEYGIYGHHQQQQQPSSFWPTAGAGEGSSNDGGDRHVPHLAEETQVPHSRS